jgi:hypothetical protein
MEMMKWWLRGVVVGVVFVWAGEGFGQAGSFLSPKEGQTVEQAVAEAARPNVGFLKNGRLPAYLGKPREGGWVWEYEV